MIRKRNVLTLFLPWTLAITCMHQEDCSCQILAQEASDHMNSLVVDYNSPNSYVDFNYAKLLLVCVIVFIYHFPFRQVSTYACS